MKQYFLLIFLSLIIVNFTGCVATNTQITKGEYYPKIFQQQPKSILVLPARNSTTSVDATDHFRYTVTKPLAEQGYYVFPIHLVDTFFKSENLSDAEIIRNIPVAKLKEVFNPDAILYVDINAWDTGYSVVSSNVDVGLSFSLIDANSGDEIWQNDAYAYSYSGLEGSNGIAGLIVSAIAVAINTGTDYTQLAYVANNAGVSMLPSGQYRPGYKKDFEQKIIFRDIATLEEERIYVDEYFIFGNKQEGPVPLTVRGHAKGYFAFSVNSLNFFNHNGYKNYYLTQEINGQKFLRNRFFRYENNQPYLLSKNKKVFIFTETDGSIPYSEENSRYYFQVSRIIELKKAEEPKKNKEV